MKDEIISYETAKLAKEKGFDWACYKHYQLSLTEQVDGDDGMSGPFGWEKDELTLQSDYFINNWEDADLSNKSWYMCSAPTQSLLQRWLREKHNILVNVDCGVVNDWWYQIKHTPTLKTKVYKYTSLIDEFLRYEDALEEGLQEGLKLIIL